MEAIREIEMIHSVPEGLHEVHNAEVLVLKMNELAVGEVILLGDSLIQIQDITQSDVPDALDICHNIMGLPDTITAKMPKSSVFNRVIKATCFQTREDKSLSPFTFERMRKPILGEKMICGICSGECDEVDQKFIDNFEKDEDVCGNARKCYNIYEDRFMSYDGCENESPR